MRIRSSKSETMVEFPLRFGAEFCFKGKSLSMDDNEMKDQQTHRRRTCSNVVSVPVYCGPDRPESKSDVLCSQCHLWSRTVGADQRMQPWIPVGGISFLSRVVRDRDKVSTSAALLRELRVELLLLHTEKSQDGLSIWYERVWGKGLGRPRTYWTDFDCWPGNASVSSHRRWRQWLGCLGLYSDWWLKNLNLDKQKLTDGYMDK